MNLQDIVNLKRLLLTFAGIISVILLLSGCSESPNPTPTVETNCSQCHTPPAFASETFRVIGVDSEDPGRAGVHAEGVYGAFNVPTLRNITQSAPYMHDGSFATLPQVVEFYAAGGGRLHDFEYVDPLIKGFELTDQEKADLVAFLGALTDVSGLPDVPETAVSGLPIQYKK